MAKQQVKNAGKYSYRKTKKLLRKHGYNTKSSQRQKYVTKAGKAGSWAARRLVDHYSNPPMQKVTKSSGWIKATAIKFVKRGGVMQVLVRKPGKKRKSKKGR